MDNYQTIINFCRRPHVYVLKENYSNYVDFLTGLFIGMGINQNFYLFLSEKYKTKFALHWSSYILNEIAFKNEKIAIQELFGLLIEFTKLTTDSARAVDD